MNPLSYTTLFFYNFSGAFWKQPALSSAYAKKVINTLIETSIVLNNIINLYNPETLVINSQLSYPENLSP